MKRFFIYLFAIVLLIASNLYSEAASKSVESGSNDNIRLGISGAITHTYNSMDIGNYNGFGKYNFGYNQWFDGSRFGLEAEYEAKSGLPVVLGMKLNYSDQKHKAHTEYDTAIYAVIQGAGVRFRIPNDEFDISSKLNYISLSPYIKFKLFSALYIAGGASLNFLTQSNITFIKSSYQSINLPLNVAPSPNRAYETILNKEIPDIHSTFLSLNLGLEYQIKYDVFRLCPTVEYEYYPENLTDTFNWQQYAFNLGIGLTVDL